MALFQQSMLGFPCSAQAIPFPNLFGAEFLRLEASLVSNYSQFVYEGYYLNHNSLNVTDVSFCNVSLAYTHPGQSDTINVQVWLPTVAWNGRMQGIGGSGWSAGMTPFSFTAMAGAVGEGYVGVTTDGGHNSDADPSDWALLSPGNVNLYALQDFGSVSLNDAAVIGKELAKSFYGRPPRYSYFSGCSQGGRQGYMLAQRYPTAYDGIAASAPAIYLSQFVFGAFWPQLFMALLGEYPHPCEFDAITAAAVAACDSSDGAVDGIVSDPDSCQFDPYSLVGTTINCSDTGRDQQISVAAAKVVNATWAGAVSSTGSFLWHGLNRDAVLTGPLGTASTECDVNGTCAGKPASLITDWIRLFVQKDPAFSVSNMTHTEFDRLFHASVQQFTSIIGTNDANLAEFRDAGGKMLTYHGLADSIIHPNGTRQYYEAVTALDPNVHDFYRLFESPGLGHCFGGSGGYPGDMFNSLVAWVETGEAPNMLNATTLPDQYGRVHHRLLCPYPKKARYIGCGDVTSALSFECAT